MGWCDKNFPRKYCTLEAKTSTLIDVRQKLKSTINTWWLKDVIVLVLYLNVVRCCSCYCVQNDGL